MNAWLQIGHNDVRLFLREKTWGIWMFVVPLVFVYFMGFAIRGPGQAANPRPAVLIENQDAGFLGRLFLEELGEQGLTAVSPTNRADAKRGLRIPSDFTERVLAKQRVNVAFFKTEGADDQAAAMVEVRLVRALIGLNSRLVEHATAGGGQPPTEAALRGLMRRENPVALQASFAGHKPVPVGFNLSLPGNLVMYLMMNLLIFGGASLAWERRSGVLRRLRICPIPSSALVLGKIYGLMLLGGLQIAVFLTVGQFVLGVNVRAHLPGIVLTLVIYAWVAASLGLLVGALVKAEEKVVGLCLLLSLAMAAFGGCWWPLELVSPRLQIVAHLVPAGWAMDALHQLITFGAGLEQAWQEIGVLILYGAAFNFAAAKCLRV